MDRMLEPAGLGEVQLSRTLGSVMTGGVDYADLYFQVSRHESWSLEDGLIREGSFSVDQGVGVRAISGEKTGFAYSDELVLPALERAATAARAIARQGKDRSVPAWQRAVGKALYSSDDPTTSIADAQKTKLLGELDAATRALDPRVKQVIISLSSNQDQVLVAASDGTLAADIRPLVRLNVSVVVGEGDRMEAGGHGGGGRIAYETLLDPAHWQAGVDEALRQALVNLESVDTPAGEMPVVLGAGWPGILLHEAVGHGLEGDFNRKKTSAFSGLLGERVASPGVTVLDDGTLQDRRGSLTIDDEGTPSQATVLIEDGILRGYMQDRQNARLMGMQPTGNGRRQSYAHIPMPRMTNTVMQSGDKDPQEILASVKKGLYAVNFGGGQVDITSGKFVFSCTEAYLIEDGKIGAPVKGATLIGNGPDVMTKVKMIGNDMKLDDGIGTCGKEGQGVPVGVGQPTMLIDAITVGGTAA